MEVFQTIFTMTVFLRVVDKWHNEKIKDKERKYARSGLMSSWQLTN